MANRKDSVGSSPWLRERFSDKYIRLLRENKGLRSRAWFKLDEIQKTDKVFKSGMSVVDLGSSPGGWSQYASGKVGKTGRVIACDLLLMHPIIGVSFFQGDFRDAGMFKLLVNQIGNKKAQVVMSDMSPNMSGISVVDISRSMHLSELALNMCHYVLIKGGTFIVKVFHGEGFDEYLKKIFSLFLKVRIRKPDASRSRSREVYIVATRYKI